MLFKKIILENFKSYRNETVIDVSVNDDNKNIILIGGKNGAGKTSIIEAINTILYGASPRKIISYINDRAIQEGNARCRLGLIFIDDNDNEIKIEREWIVRGVYDRLEDNIKPSMIESSFKARKNGDRWDIDETRWNEEIDVKIPKGVSEFFFFAGEAVREMSSDITPNSLKSSIEKVIGLERINTLIQDLGRVKEKVTFGNSGIGDEQIKQHKLKIMMKDSEITQESNNLEKIKAEYEQIKEDRDAKQDRCNSIFGSSEAKNEQIKEYDEKINNINSDITLIDANITNFFNTQLPLSLMGPFYEKLNSNLKEAKEYREYLGRKSSQTELIKKIIDGLYKPNDIIWNNEWHDDYHETLQNKLLSILNEKESKKSLLDVTETDEQRISELWHNIDFQGSTTIDLISEREKKLRELKRLTTEKENLYVNPDKEKEWNELQKDIGRLNVNLGEIESKKEKSSSKLEELNEEKLELYKELRKMQDGYQQFQKQERILKKIDSYMKVLKKYKEKYRNSKISKLTDNIELMFRRLYEKESLLSKIVIDPENFEIQLFDKGGIQIPKAQLADGEKTLFAIATVWGLSKTSEISLPIVTDAPLSALAKGPVENVLRNYFPNASKQVIILIKDRDLMPNSNEHNMIKPYIEKEYVLNFDKDTESTTLHDGYFYNY